MHDIPFVEYTAPLNMWRHRTNVKVASHMKSAATVSLPFTSIVKTLPSFHVLRYVIVQTVRMPHKLIQSTGKEEKVVIGF
jgi:hypothetical protein